MNYFEQKIDWAAVGKVCLGFVFDSRLFVVVVVGVIVVVVDSTAPKSLARASTDVRAAHRDQNTSRQDLCCARRHCGRSRGTHNHVASLARFPFSPRSTSFLIG